MEKQKKQDLMSRKEASAPNLTPIQYFEGPDFVCCSEVFKKPRLKVCEGTPSQQDPRTQCVRKGKRVFKVCEWPKDYNERDILFRPIRWRCSTPKKKHKKGPPEPSLGSPIGLSKSSFGMKFLEGKQSEQILLGFATNLVAYAEYYITPEIEWDEKVLNRILLEGQRLYVDSRASIPPTEKPKEINIKRSFKLCDNTFDILLNDAFMVGQVIGQEAAIPNLHWGLLKFFKKFQFCLLQIENWYVLLWKNADVYFIFDCYGRRPLDLMSDRHRGVAVLVCLRHIENVSHFIMNMSGVHSEDFFIIRHLQVKSLTPCGGKPADPIVDRAVEFETVTPDYAILRATIHLGSSCFKEIRFRHAIPVAFCALINAKIDPTPTWNRAVLDKIIKLGADFYKQWTKCDISVDLGITDVPSSFIFGQFVVEIDVIALAENGLWKCTPSYQMSELTQALSRAFSKNSNIVVQIQSRTYALWRKGEFFYILDPYSHQCSLEKKKIVTASLRMCGSFDKMCCIFTQVLLELFEESNFIIHYVRMLKIYEWDSNRGKSCEIPCICLATQNTDGQEVASINESVIGNYGYVCKDEEEIIESDSADLDSPGLSQTRLEDYTDLRRDFIEESDEETEDDDEEDLDLDSRSEKDDDESDESGGGDGKKDKKDKSARSKKKGHGSDTSDDGTGAKGKKKKKGRKGGKGGDDDDDDGGGDRKGKKGKKGRKGGKGGGDADDDEAGGKKSKKGKKGKKGGKGGDDDDDDGGGKGGKGKKKKSKKGSDDSSDDEDGGDGKAKKKKSKSKNGSDDEGGGKDGKGKKKKSKSKDGSDDDGEGGGKDGKGKKKKSKGKDGKDGKDDDDGGGKDGKGKGKKSKGKDGKDDDDGGGKDGKGKGKKSKSKNGSDDEKGDGKKKKGSKGIDDPSKKKSNQGQSEDDGGEDGRKKGGGKGDRGGRGSPDAPSATSRRQKHQRRKEQDGDDTSTSDEFEFGIPGSKPNSYPGYTEDPQNLAVVGSESGNYDSLCNLLKSGFRCADRILTMTPWGDYVCFRHNTLYFVFDGCTCNLRAIRHMDLSVGTAGLLCYPDLHSLIVYIENGKNCKKPTTHSKKNIVDQICDKYCC